MNDVTKASHAKRGWWVKVLCGVALIVGVVTHYLMGIPPLFFKAPVLLAQSLVIGGTVLVFWHFLLLRRLNKELELPEVLVTDGGLYCVVRHPMYFADAIYYTGLALLWPSVTSAVILLVGLIALVYQAHEEDRWCAQRFPHEFPRWSARSALLIPYLY